MAEEKLNLVTRAQNESLPMVNKLLRLLHEEMTASELSGILGSVLIAASDNALYWMLNKDSAIIISQWLNVTGRTAQFLKYAIIINGAGAISAMDLTATEKLVTFVNATIRRIKIIPDYQQWFVTVVTVSALISIFGVSGAVGLTYNLYHENKILAVMFGVATMFVNLFTSTFFFQGLFDRARKYFITRSDSEIARLQTIKYCFAQFAFNVSQLDNDDFKDLSNHLQLFHRARHNNKETTATVLNELRPLFKTESGIPLNLGLPDHNNVEMKPYLGYLLALPISMLAAYIYYHVGRQSFKSFVEDRGGESPELINCLVGICMGIMAHMAVLFSASVILNAEINAIAKGRKNYVQGCCTKSSLLQLGKGLVKSTIIFTASLATINLVNSTINVKSKVFKSMLYMGGVVQASFINAYCLVNTSPREIITHCYQEVGRLFVRKVEVEKKRFVTNIHSLIDQFELATNSDVMEIYNVLEHDNLLPENNERNSP
jgi:hypothetical protein